MAKMTKMGGDPKPEAPKKEKRPLVNWFSREKEVEFSNKKVGNKDMNVKTKVVKAPESVISKGFEKKVVKTSTPLAPEKREKRMMMGDKIAVGSVGLGAGSILLNNAIGRRKEAKNIDNIINTVDRYNTPRTFNTPAEYDKYKADRTRDYNAAKNKLEKDSNRNQNVSKALLTAIPLTFTSAIAISSKKNEGKSTRVATKTVTPRKKRG